MVDVISPGEHRFSEREHVIGWVFDDLVLKLEAFRGESGDTLTSILRPEALLDIIGEDAFHALLDYVEKEFEVPENADIDVQSRSSWRALIFGSFNKEMIATAVRNVHWQALRVTLHGLSLEERRKRLQTWVDADHPRIDIQLRQIAVTNYVNALKRAGMLPLILP